ARRSRGARRESLERKFLVHAVHFVEHFPGHDLGDVVLGITLAVAHPDFGRLLRNRLVGVDTDPDATAALDVARHGSPGGFDLPRSETAAGHRLQAVLAEADPGADGRHTLVAT